MIFPDLTDEAVMDEIIANSYKDFHAKGLDYICLYRSPTLTRKVYFLNGDVSKVPEVVNPHNHRYDFATTVLAGAMLDHVYAPVSDVRWGVEYNKFNYMTPLNGGNGFTYVGTQLLGHTRVQYADDSMPLSRRMEAIHTIQMLEDQTVLLLEQYIDKLPISVPTQCWTRKGEPKPDLSGLYSKFTPDEVINRVQTIKELTSARPPLLRAG